MIKTLKSELKLRSTYDEMIGMIEEQDKENRPPIEQIIDRRATLFRNNQFGSQFDNIGVEEARGRQSKRGNETGATKAKRNRGRSINSITINSFNGFQYTTRSL